MDVYELFLKFELDSLPKEWVQNQWRNYYPENVDFPSEYEDFLDNDTNIDELLGRASVFIQEWLELEDCGNVTFTNRASTSNFQNSSNLNTSRFEKSWQHLISNNVQHKALISVLSVFIMRGKTGKELDVRVHGLLATNLYIRLLAIPGCQVYDIFDPILYSHAMENLKICSSLDRTAPKTKPTGKAQNGRQDEGTFDEDKNNSHVEFELLPKDQANIIKVVGSILDNLLFTLKRFQLKGQDDSLLITIQTLILIVRTNHSSSAILSKTPHWNTSSNLASKAYKILLLLCRPDHGGVNKTVILIMKEIIPAFLVFEQKCLNTTSREEVKSVKDHSLQFVQSLLHLVQDDAFVGVWTLVQNICLRIPEKVEPRTKGVQIVIELLNVLPHTLYSHLVVWIMKLCHNDQVRNRITGLEIVSKLLFEPEKTPSSPLRPFPVKYTSTNHNEHENVENRNENSQLPDFSKHKFLLGTVFSRCQDTASSVRSKALSILASLVSLNDSSVSHLLESIFVEPYLACSNIDSSDVYEKPLFDFHQFLKNIKTETNANVDPLPSGKAVISLLEVLIEDEKVLVRKSAFQVLTKIFLLNEKLMSNQLLQLMVDNCRDHAVSVRKLLVQCLTELLGHYPSHPQLPRYWVMGVMPLLADQEIKSQEKALDALKTTISDNIVSYNQMKTAHHALPWTLLGLIAEFKKRHLFLFACYKWTTGNLLRQNLIKIIKTHIDTENNAAAWFLLASISEYIDIQDPQFVLEYFYSNVLKFQKVDEYCCQLVTEVMHLSWRKLNQLDQIKLCETILQLLHQFDVPLPMISRCIDICQLVTESNADTSKKAQESIKQWASQLITTSESKLQEVVESQRSLQGEDETRLAQYIFTIGDAAQICPSVVQESSIELFKNLLELEGESEKNNSTEKRKFTVGAMVQAVAATTLGKLCLQKDQLAHSIVPLFGHLLSETPHPEIKINIMVGLTDMCMRFTSIVEKNCLTEMCYCLKDKSLEVRENTLKLLIQLLQEDFLKLRCPMFFHLLTMLNDEDQIIRDTISSFIINSVVSKQAHFLKQHFVESLFHYNHYLGHTKYNRVGSKKVKERVLFSLEGSGRQELRRNIYKFMLENMLDDDRFAVFYRLCTDVLSGVAEEGIDLSACGVELLKDALFILSCEEIKLNELKPTKAKQNEDEDEVFGGNELLAVSSLGRKILVSQVVKKNMVENVIPIIIKLKRKLRQLKSPLVQELMSCLRELMQDYKTEINEILAADKELAAEISYDLENLKDRRDESRSGPNLSHNDILKEAAMVVVKFSEVRKSLNTSTRNKNSPGKNGTSSSVASPNSDKSPLKSPNQTGSKGSSTSRKSSGSICNSPGSNFASPGCSKSTSGHSETIQNWEVVNSTPNKNQNSSSASPNSFVGQGIRCSTSPPEEVKSKEVAKQRNRRTSSNSSVSEASFRSGNKKTHKKSKKKK